MRRRPRRSSRPVAIVPTLQPGYYRGVTAPAPAAVLDLANLREAQAALAGVARRTPLIESAALSRLVGAPVFLKAEQLQPIGAFKIRGAYTAIRRLSEEIRARGVVTHSSGNHAQAVAWVARHFGIPAVIVMPVDAPRVKRDAVVAMGAELVSVADRSEREPTALRIALERGIVMIPPFESMDVIAGQATTGLEIVEQLPAVAEVLVPVGGGGLLAGIALALSLLCPEAEAIGVEPVSAAKLALALRAGAPTRLAAPRGASPTAFCRRPSASSPGASSPAGCAGRCRWRTRTSPGRYGSCTSPRGCGWSPRAPRRWRRCWPGRCVPAARRWRC